MKDIANNLNYIVKFCVRSGSFFLLLPNTQKYNFQKNLSDDTVCMNFTLNLLDSLVHIIIMAKKMNLYAGIIHRNSKRILNQI